MAYERPITIMEMVDNIRRKNYVLPSIQREFVWKTDQIEQLFDSLLRDYPISTFLFWQVEKTKINDFQFYEFLSNYHEKDSRHNKRIHLNNDEDIIAILDGQQRMTSLYIGLFGSFSEKMPYYRKESMHAYPRKKLYLNLLQNSPEIEMEFDFRFLTKDQTINDKNHYWFDVSKILEFNEPGDAHLFLVDEDITDTSKYDKSKSKFASNTLNRLWNIIHQKGTISYFLEKGEELDKVLQIFIRINSGGTKLSYSDLLLSIATAKWKEKDAREIIHQFVDDINQIGDGFKFNKDLVLKSCLVLSDFTDVKFKVDNFTNKNMSIIEENWDKISSSVQRSIELVSKFGYNSDNLLATNAIIPIAYFIHKNNFHDYILHSSKNDKDRTLIKEWIARSLLKGTFGGQPDSLYPIYRNVINDNLGRFPLDAIIDRFKGKPKSIIFDEDDINNILELSYGKAKTYCALTLLYPSLNPSFKYHQDHIHPKSFFNRRKLSKMNIQNSDIEEYMDRYNNLPNIQLLQANMNTEKSDKQLNDWIKETYSKKEKDSFLIDNHIDLKSSLDFGDFINFYEKRKEILKKKISKVLNVEIS